MGEAPLPLPSGHLRPRPSAWSIRDTGWMWLWALGTWNTGPGGAPVPSASSPPAWPPHRAVRRATASVSDGAGAGGPAATPRPAAGRGGQPAAAPLPAVGRLSSPALQRCTPPPLAVHFPSWWDWSCSLRCVVCTPLHASLRLRRIRHQGHPYLPTSPRALCMSPPPPG